MKTWSFIIFFSIVLTIYGLLNLYIFRRGWAALEGAGIYRLIFLYVFLFLVLSYPVGRLSEGMFRNSFTDFLVITGSFYLGIMVYAFLFLVLIDLTRLVNHFLPFFPQVFKNDISLTSQIITLITAILVVIIVMVGHINTLFPRVRNLEITVDKKVPILESLKAVVVSDIHLGTVIRSDRLKRIVEKINSLEPDVVLLPGDIVDEDVAPVAEQNIAAILSEIRSRFGTFAITGNHEYFSGVEAAVSYMEQGNITVLQDTAIKVSDAFYVVGRKDLMAERLAGGRNSLETILEGVDRSLPLILMDHQPYHLEVAERNGIDLQLSGHTHHGQLFPFNYITRVVYELSWGYRRRGDTHYYVSCGVGTWGPPVRTNSVPEIVVIHMNFKSAIGE